MSYSPTLAELRETLARREDLLKEFWRPEQAHDRRVVEADMAEIRRDIAAKEKPARIEISNNPPMGSA